MDPASLIWGPALSFLNPNLSAACDREYRYGPTDSVGIRSDYSVYQKMDQPGMGNGFPSWILREKLLYGFLWSENSHAVTGSVRDRGNLVFSEIGRSIYEERFDRSSWLTLVKASKDNLKYNFAPIVSFISDWIINSGVLQGLCERLPDRFSERRGNLGQWRIAPTFMCGNSGRIEAGGIGPHTNNCKRTCLTGYVNFALQFGLQLTVLPERVGADQDFVLLYDDNHARGIANRGQNSPSYIRRNDAAFTLFGGDAQNIVGEDLDVSCDGKTWLHLF